MTSCMRAAWWVSTWLTTTFIRPHVKPDLMSSVKIINAALMPFAPPLHSTISLGMAPLLNYTLAPPLSSYCFNTGTTLHSRASVGYHFTLECCVEVSLGFHNSHSPVCNYNGCSFIFPAGASLALLAHFNMPILCSRMSCRRGSSRGRVTC